MLVRRSFRYILIPARLISSYKLSKQATPRLSLGVTRLLSLCVALCLAPGLFADILHERTTGQVVTNEATIRDVEIKVPDYHYISMAKPNPFIPPLVSSLIAKTSIPIDSSLQRFPLLDLSLVGIWTLRNGIKKGLVMTPQNEGVVVGLQSSIGKRGGKITAIDESSMTVREFSLASDGSRQYEDQKIWLTQDAQATKKEADSYDLHSEKIGQPNRFGYGEKNYLNSPTYEKYHKEIQHRLQNYKQEEAVIDESRPKIRIEELVPPPSSPAYPLVRGPQNSESIQVPSTREMNESNRQSGLMIAPKASQVNSNMPSNSAPPGAPMEPPKL